MASVQTVKAFLTRASTQLTDVNPQFQRWKQTELLTYMNDGYLAIAKFMPWTFSRSDAIRLKKGTRQSIELIAANDILVNGETAATAPLRGSYLLSIDYNLGADGLTPGRTIFLVDKEVLDRGSPKWRMSADDEVAEYTYDPRLPKEFQVNPGVMADADVWVMASIVPEPALHDTTIDHTSGAGASIVLAIADTYADELLNYALARAYMKDAEVEGSANMVAIHSKLFADSINALVKARTGVNPNLKSLPLNPATDATAS